MEKCAYDFALKFSPYLLVRDGRVVEIGDMWLEITGHFKQEIIGLRISELWKLLFGSDFSGLKPDNSGQLYSMFTREKQVKSIQIYCSEGENGESIFIFEEIHSYSDNNIVDKMERLLNEKDEFLSYISHELRTPLTVINSAVQVMQQLYKEELSSNTQKYITRIKQNSLRLLRLVNNLLDITRSNAGQIKVHKRNMDIVFISREITESIAIYAQEKQIRLNFISSVSEKIIAVDDEKYERILLNLLSNAIKFTPKGKSVFVSISLVNDYVCIQVKDEGVGIPKEKQEHIFSRFGQVDSLATRQDEGTGIGLTLVKSLVYALEGNIYVESAEGKGSTFTVLLPDNRIEEMERVTPSDMMKDNLVLTTNIEFADIYL